MKIQKHIFVEVAYFTPENIRRTSRDLGIFTDSSYRNERGLDREKLDVAMDRIMSLIQEVAEGQVLSETIDKYIEKVNKIEIPLNIPKFYKFAGKEIDSDIIGRILASLGISIKSLDVNNMLFRTTIQRRLKKNCRHL